MLAAADETRPLRGLARIMVKTMSAAWTVPHFGYCDEIEMDGLIALRDRLKPLAASRGVKLSYMPMILKATSLALNQYPDLNAHIAADASEVTIRGSHNIGVAMDTPRGLIVPNIKDCQARSILEIAQELNRLQGLASQGKLSEDDLAGGTFTLSNIGAIGGTYASPVLFVPQIAIGAIGKMQRVPRFGLVTVDGPNGTPVQEEQVVAKHIMRVSWAADHRVVDGATMARFSNQWKAYLEEPMSMVADLR